MTNNTDPIDDLAKDIVNGRIAKFYQKEGVDLSPTTKAHMLEAAKKAITTEILKARQRSLNWFMGTLEHNSYKDTIKLAQMQLDDIEKQLNELEGRDG